MGDNVLPFPDAQARSLLRTLEQLTPEDQRAVEAVVEIMHLLSQLAPPQQRIAIEVARKLSALAVEHQVAFLERLTAHMWEGDTEPEPPA